ncbi:MAG: hypothetical protein ACREDL_25700, partial [Bradyrhizobium sp.]
MAESHHQRIDLVCRFTKRLGTKRFNLTTREPLTYFLIAPFVVGEDRPPTVFGVGMMVQGSFFELEYAAKKRRTRRELFLAEMDRV